MNRTRRRLALAPIAAAVCASAAGAASAQTAIVEGKHYLRLATPVPTGAPPTKIEVVDFFWYECPHCNAFEPALEAWAQRLPDDVTLRLVPVWFREEPFGPQQRLFYTLDALGLLAQLHGKVFQTIHERHVRLRTPEDMSAFALTNGLDPVKFMTVFNSAAVRAKCEAARAVAAGYGLDGVPAMGVQGRFFTNGTLANGGVAGGSNERMLVVIDTLAAQLRRGTKA